MPTMEATMGREEVSIMTIFFWDLRQQMKGGLLLSKDMVVCPVCKRWSHMEKEARNNLFFCGDEMRGPGYGDWSISGLEAAPFLQPEGGWLWGHLSN